MDEFYEITIKNYEKKFIFCKREEYQKKITNMKDVIFTNTYIHDDDT